MERYTITFPPDLMAKVDKDAAEMHISRSAFLRLAAEEAHVRHLREALTRKMNATMYGKEEDQ